jgi:hypothetical protein
MLGSKLGSFRMKNIYETNKHKFSVAFHNYYDCKFSNFQNLNKIFEKSHETIVSSQSNTGRYG